MDHKFGVFAAIRINYTAADCPWLGHANLVPLSAGDSEQLRGVLARVEPQAS